MVRTSFKSFSFRPMTSALEVAVTRAQSLLVVIGDPYVLALDALWKEFINFVHRNGGFKVWRQLKKDKIKTMASRVSGGKYSKGRSEEQQLEERGDYVAVPDTTELLDRPPQYHPSGSY